LAGGGRNLVLGDHGRVTAANSNGSRFEAQPITLGLVETIEPTIGGNDTITTGIGADVILGGLGADVIVANLGEVYVRGAATGNRLDSDNVVVGDHGYVDWTRADRPGAVTGADGDASDIDLLVGTDPTLGGIDTITTGAGNDIVMGGTAGDTIRAGAGNDLVFGDNGIGQATAVAGGGVIQALLPMSMPISLQPFTFTSIFTQNADLGGNDRIFGEDGDDIVLGQQGDDLIYGGNDDDDLIGGHNVAGGQDGSDRIDGSVAGVYATAMGWTDAWVNDGKSDNDVILGDNGIVQRTGDTLSPRFHVLQGGLLYDANGQTQVTGASQSDPAGTDGRAITLLDHSYSIQDTAAGHTLFGNDYLAGGADDDMIFGGLGDDAIQGDGSIALTVGATRLGDGTLSVQPSRRQRPMVTTISRAMAATM
jgi:Ca2+-binding RTX toxin-like protein